MAQSMINGGLYAILAMTLGLFSWWIYQSREEVPTRKRMSPFLLISLSVGTVMCYSVLDPNLSSFKLLWVTGFTLYIPFFLDQLIYLNPGRYGYSVMLGILSVALLGLVFNYLYPSNFSLIFTLKDTVPMFAGILTVLATLQGYYRLGMLFCVLAGISICLVKM